MKSFPAVCECDGAGECKAIGRIVSSGHRAECAGNHHFRLMLARVPLDQWPENNARRRGVAEVVLQRDCVHLGTRPTPPADPDGVECLCAAKEVWTCDLHGRCTRGMKFDGVACCNGCPDLEAADD